MLFGGYRRAEAHDPDAYVLAITSVLAAYDESIIDEVCNPLHGISTRDKFQSFPPNSGELKKFCDEVQAYRARIANYTGMPRLRVVENPKAPGRRANLHVPKDVPHYADMVKRAETADPADWHWTDRGIKVPVSWYEPYAKR